MWRVIEAAVDYVDEVFQLRHWFDEWNTRRSPVAFWLAVITFVILVFLTVAYGHLAWERIREHLGGAGESDSTVGAVVKWDAPSNNQLQQSKRGL